MVRSGWLTRFQTKLQQLLKSKPAARRSQGGGG